jgi:hypothetical protein
MLMKKVFRCFIFMLVLLPMYCASGEPRAVDLTSKGVIKAEVIIQNQDNFMKIRAIRLYFKKLDSPDDLSNGKIIYSDVRDGDFVIINCDPGTYVVIAASVIEDMDHVIVCFNEDIMKYTKTEIKAGDSVELKSVFVNQNSVNLFGSVSDLQTHHRKVIGKNLGSSQVLFKLAELDRTLNKNSSKILDKPVKNPDDQVIEEYK